MTKQDYLKFLWSRVEQYEELSLQMDDIMKQLQKLHQTTRLQTYLLKRSLQSMEESTENTEGGNKDD